MPSERVGDPAAPYARGSNRDVPRLGLELAQPHRAKASRLMFREYSRGRTACSSCTTARLPRVLDAQHAHTRCPWWIERDGHDRRHRTCSRKATSALSLSPVLVRPRSQPGWFSRQRNRVGQQVISASARPPSTLTACRGSLRPDRYAHACRGACGPPPPFAAPLVPRYAPLSRGDPPRRANALVRSPIRRTPRPCPTRSAKASVERSREPVDYPCLRRIELFPRRASVSTSLPPSKARPVPS